MTNEQNTNPSTEPVDPNAPAAKVPFERIGVGHVIYEMHVANAAGDKSEPKAE